MEAPEDFLPGLNFSYLPGLVQVIAVVRVIVPGNIGFLGGDTRVLLFVLDNNESDDSQNQNSGAGQQANPKAEISGVASLGAVGIVLIAGLDGQGAIHGFNVVVGGDISLAGLDDIALDLLGIGAGIYGAVLQLLAVLVEYAQSNAYLVVGICKLGSGDVLVVDLLAVIGLAVGLGGEGKGRLGDGEGAGNTGDVVLAAGYTLAPFLMTAPEISFLAVPALVMVPLTFTDSILSPSASLPLVIL